MLARAGKYNDVMFHRLVPGFMVRIYWTGDGGYSLPVRCKRVTPQGLVQEESRTGGHLSVMNMTTKAQPLMTVEVHLQWPTKVQIPTGVSIHFDQRYMVCLYLRVRNFT